MLAVLQGHILGSLGQQFLMTSTREPNTMAPQSALCICSRKWKTKLIIQICYGTGMSKFCFKIISFSSVASKLTFDWGDSETNFDQACSTTVSSMLRALRAIFQVTTGKTLMPTSCSYIGKGELDNKVEYKVEKQVNEKHEGKLKDDFGW